MTSSCAMKRAPALRGMCLMSAHPSVIEPYIDTASYYRATSFSTLSVSSSHAIREFWYSEQVAGLLHHPHALVPYSFSVVSTLSVLRPYRHYHHPPLRTPLKVTYRCLEISQSVVFLELDDGERTHRRQQLIGTLSRWAWRIGEGVGYIGTFAP